MLEFLQDRSQPPFGDMGPRQTPLPCSATCPRYWAACAPHHVDAHPHIPVTIRLHLASRTRSWRGFYCAVIAISLGQSSTLHRAHALGGGDPSSCDLRRSQVRVRRGLRIGQPRNGTLVLGLHQLLGPVCTGSRHHLSKDRRFDFPPTLLLATGPFPHRFPSLPIASHRHPLGSKRRRQGKTR